MQFYMLQAEGNAITTKKKNSLKKHIKIYLIKEMQH